LLVLEGEAAVVEQGPDKDVGQEGMMQKAAGRVLGPIPYDPNMLKTAGSFEQELDRQVDLAQEKIKKLPRIKRIFGRKLKAMATEAADRAGQVVGVGD
jgi:hypothetical protein